MKKLMKIIGVVLVGVASVVLVQILVEKLYKSFVESKYISAYSVDEEPY